MHGENRQDILAAIEVFGMIFWRMEGCRHSVLRHWIFVLSCDYRLIRSIRGDDDLRSWVSKSGSKTQERHGVVAVRYILVDRTKISVEFLEIHSGHNQNGLMIDEIFDMATGTQKRQV